MSFSRTIFFLAFLCIVSEAELKSCAKMDSASKVARAACITSCSVQNCGTGYCEKRRGQPTCVCSRCAHGRNVPLDKIIGAAVKG